MFHRPVIMSLAGVHAVKEGQVGQVEADVAVWYGAVAENRRNPRPRSDRIRSCPKIEAIRSPSDALP